MASCQRCNKSHSLPEAFLLTCRECRRTWHHRCLMPPMEDLDLIQLIRATNAKDRANDLSSWMCRRCKKRASTTPNTLSSREQTMSTESREPSLTTCNGPAVGVTESTISSGVASTSDVRVKQEWSAIVDLRPVKDHKKSERPEPRLGEAASVKNTFVAERTRPPAVNQPQPQPGPIQPRETDVRMTSAALQEREKFPQRPFPPTHSHLVKAARKIVNAVTSLSKDDVEMQVDSPLLSETTLRATSSQSHASTTPESVRVASTAIQRVEAVVQPQVNQVATNEVDDDPEDLYGPPVERRIIRILPSLAEELREQQRRVAADKEKRRAPLAPDWILARHVNDPLWKEIPTGTQKRRKPIARKLEENGLNVNELMACFTVQDWIRDKKRSL